MLKIALPLALALSSLLIGNSMAASLNSDEVLNPVKRGVENKLYEDGPTLKIASFNVGAARVSDIKTVASAVALLDADLISLNEVDRLTKRSGGVDQIAEIAKEAKMYYSFGKAIDFDGGEYGVAFLSRFPILNSQTIKLPSGDAEQRVAFINEVQAPNFDSPIVMITTHLDFTEDHKLQLEQVRAINDLAVANVDVDFKDFTTKIKILAGDFNDTYNGPALQELSRYWNLVKDEDDREMMRTWPASNPMADLDHILTSRGQVWEVKEAQVLEDSEDFVWSNVTDHLPVVATLKLIEQ